MLEDKLYKTLIGFGINPHLQGFHYIICAVINYDPEMKAMELYEMVATFFETTPQRVERSIRHAFSTMDFKSEEVQEFFGKKFTNIGYISILKWKLTRGY